MITLQQAQLLTQDKLWNGVVDELLTDELLSMMTFDNVATYAGGSTLNYVYNKIKTQPSAGFRAINADYTAQEADTEQVTVALKILGGSFEIDRVLGEYVKGVVQQEAFQLHQKIKAIKTMFSYAFINGDAAKDDKQFDGLNKLIAKNMIYDPSLDLSTSDKIDAGYKKLTDAFRDMQAQMGRKPTAWLCSPAGYALAQKIADRAAGFTTRKDEFGNETFYFNGARFVQLGELSTTKEAVIATDKAGKTAFYPVQIGIDGVHGITPEGNNVGIKVYPIDNTDSNAVRKGSCEMVTAIALKNQRAAGKVVVQIAEAAAQDPPSEEGGGEEEDEE